MLSIKHNLPQLNRAIGRYWELSKRSWDEVLSKQGGKLAWFIVERMKRLAPARGEITRTRLAALKGGQGLLIRPSVREKISRKYKARQDIKTRTTLIGAGKNARGTIGRRGGKRVNLAALIVETELKLREKARSFLAASARYPRTLPPVAYSKSLRGHFLGKAGITSKMHTHGLRFSWSGDISRLSEHAAAGLNRAEAERQIANAIADVTDDIMEYISRKYTDNGRRV